MNRTLLVVAVLALTLTGCNDSGKATQCNKAADALRTLGTSIRGLASQDASVRLDAVNKVNTAGAEIGRAYQQQKDATAKAATRALGVHLVAAGEKAITAPIEDADAQGLVADVDSFDAACGIKS